MELRFPRVVLAEAVTHRKLRDTFGEFEILHADRQAGEDMSKNSASSRAIPVEKMIQAVLDDPFVPERFGKAGKGMQASGVLEGAEHTDAKNRWLDALYNAAAVARDMASIGVAKQDANRLLEPFAWITQVVTADLEGWSNWWALRCHHAADWKIQKIARMSYLDYRKSIRGALVLRFGQWHLPFVPADKALEFVWVPDVSRKYAPNEFPPLVRASAARCAWISYANHDREATQEAADRTFNRLFADPPIHASPLEHQGTPMTSVPQAWVRDAGLRSNLKGWLQARKLIAAEAVTRYEPSDEEIASWGLTTH